MLKTRASSITSAVPEPSSFAASPQPWPSMCAPTMYISSGCVVPTFVQNTSSRGPVVGRLAVERAQLRVGLLHRIGVDAGAARGCRASRPPPGARSPALAIAGSAAAAAARLRASGGGVVYVYLMRSVGQP